MRRARHLLLAGAACLLMLGPARAQAPDPALAELDRLQTLSQRNSAEALQALRAAAPRFTRATDADTRRTYLAALIDAAFETGQPAVVTDAVAQLQALAAERDDASARVLAVCALARQQAIAGQYSAALAALAGEAGDAARVTDPWVRWLYHLTLGTIQGGSGQFEDALANVLRSLELARALPRQAATAELRSRTHLQQIHFDMKNPQRALQTLREALPLAESLDARQALGWLHLHRGNVENVLGQLDAALAAYQQALQIARASGLTGLQATALNNMGDVHLQRKAYAQAEPVMRQAMAAARAANEPGSAALSQVNLGFALMGQGHITAGVQAVQAGIGFMREAGARPMEEQMLAELSRMYEQAGLYREAIDTTRRQQALARELFQIEREQAVGALQERFDSVERQRQIEQLAQANRVQDAELRTRRTQQAALAGAVAAALLAAGFTFWQYRRTRAANRALATARRQAEDALAEKNLFLSTASHDLRQPVHAMSLLVAAVSRRNADPAVGPLLADLKTSMDALNQMFNALLDLSRLEAGAAAPRSTTLPLRPLLAGILPLFREQARQQGLSLRLRLPPGEAMACADPVLLRQAVINLVHNALRYTEHGGVLVALRPRSHGWRVAVWDTGVGIATEDGSRIFSPYYRHRHAWRIGGAGHGLGLSVVERSARLMGATLDFRSRLGRGSCFWIDLPNGAPDTPAAPGAPDDVVTPAEGLAAPGWAGHAALSGRCLVLDDDPQVVSAWRALLTAWGVDTRAATHALEAMAVVDAGFEPQVILCDLRLRAGESGFDVLRDLMARCPQAAGALVSGEFDSPELRQAADEGYVVLRKPLDPTQLHDLLGAWLAPDPAQARSPST